MPYTQTYQLSNRTGNTQYRTRKEEEQQKQIQKHTFRVIIAQSSCITFSVNNILFGHLNNTIKQREREREREREKKRERRKEKKEKEEGTPIREVRFQKGHS